MAKFVLALSLLLLACNWGYQMGASVTEWGYSGSGGPEYWGSLSEEYRTCSLGVEQSPIDITDYAPDDGPSVAFHYAGSAIAARNNGHTVYLDYGPGNAIDVGGQRYELLGIHYHSPAEHQLDGESFAAELHLVHQDADGNLAVVGLLYRPGAASPLVQHLIDAAPDGIAEVDLTAGPPASDYIPVSMDYYGYGGSLTTPPCTEGVRWIVMQSIGTVSPEQVERLQALTHGPNNRPVQPIGERDIFAVSPPGCCCGSRRNEEPHT